VKRSQSTAFASNLTQLAFISGMIALAGLATLYNAFLMKLMLDVNHLNDFGKFYYSAINFVQGRDIYAPTPATLIQVTATESQQFWNLNPPHFTLLMVPLTWFSPKTAFAIWCALSVVAFAFAMRVVILESKTKVTAARLVVFGTALCWFVGTSSMAETGQLSWLLMWPVMSGWRAVRRERWTKAGVLWGLCIALKPFLLPVLGYFVIRRRYKSAVTAGLSIVLSFAVGLFFCGIQAHQSWLSVLGHSARWAAVGMNASLLSILSRSFVSNPFYEHLSQLPYLVSPLWVLSSAVVGVIVLWWFYQTRHSSDADEDLLIILLATLVVSPLGWVYYLWFLFGPAFVIAQRYELPMSVKVSLAALCCPLHLTLFGQPNPLFTVSVGSMYAWATLFIFGGILMTVRKRVVSLATEGASATTARSFSEIRTGSIRATAADDSSQRAAQ
jgi:hypothetical protein